MNFRQMEIFVRVIEAGSMTEAAVALGLSQPAVSKSLRVLEEGLGFALFHRGVRGVQPTNEGRALYLEAQRMIENFANLSAFARDLPRQGHARLEISCIPALSLAWLPDAVMGFLAEFPDASLTFQTRSSPQTMQLVAQGGADVGISQVWAEDSQVHKTHLLDIGLICVVPLTHRLADNAVVTLEDLNGEQLVLVGKSDAVRKSFEAGMHLRGLRFTSRIEVGVGAMLLRMVEASGCVGLIDEQSARMHLPGGSVLLPLSERIAVPIFLLESAVRPQSLFTRHFVEHLLAHAARGRRN